MGENVKVLCSISTKNRYDSLLLTVLSIINQTFKPSKIIIFDDGQHRDLRKDDVWYNVFKLAFKKNIEIEVHFTSGRGQHHNHQIANKMTDYDYIWRIDDDEVAESDVLEKLLSYMSYDVGAVGGCVIDPIYSSTEEGSNKLEDIFTKPNIQWKEFKGIREVEHLYSSFIYRPGIVDYELRLSPVAHREETIFSHRLFRKGYKLIVNPNAITWHLRAKTGGIRDNTDISMWHWDEKIFSGIMENEWGIKVISLGTGLGDHISFLNVLPELINKHKKLIIGCCYPEVFEDYSLKLVPYGATEKLDENIYKWMWDNKWQTSIVNAYSKLYGVKEITFCNEGAIRELTDDSVVVISPFSNKMRNGKPNPKNYPYWKRLVEILKEKKCNIIQIGVDGEEQLVDDFRVNLKLKDIVKLLNKCDTWISVDNFLQHLAHHYRCRGGIVLWGKSDPNIFGYPENININDRKNLRVNQFDIWEIEKEDNSIWPLPEELMEKINGYKTQV